MRTLIQSAIVNAILAVISVFAVIFLFLALSDIANHETDLTLEWYIAGICLFILALFIISTIVTLVMLFRYLINKVDQQKANDNR
jgi:protein-S-isoprenylcysteine O-methyltransferase Ste14